LALIVGCIVALGGPATAGGCDVHAGNDSVNGGINIHDADCDGPTTTVVPDGGGGTDPIRDSDLDGICVSTAITMGLDPFNFCAEPTDGGDVDVTPAFVAQALRFIPLPPAALQVQPPDGRTLVNFDTNFFTDVEPFDTSVSLLGQQVDLHIVPSAFAWQFGDGDTVTTAEPGSPYPKLDVTHSYLTKGQVSPRVDTTYTARFRVNGGPWRDVPGSVTIAGPPVDLQVLTATPTLVGYQRG
jgi:hypothetical protein